MKLYGGAETYIMALDRCEWLASCPGRFTSREKAHDTYWTGDQPSPGNGLKAEAKKIKSLIMFGIDQRSLRSWPVTDSAHYVGIHYVTSHQAKLYPTTDILSYFMMKHQRSEHRLPAASCFTNFRNFGSQNKFISAIIISKLIIIAVIITSWLKKPST